jgi:hypothetical protein
MFPLSGGREVFSKVFHRLQEDWSEEMELGVTDGGEEVVEGVLSEDNEGYKEMVLNQVVRPLSHRVQLAETEIAAEYTEINIYRIGMTSTKSVSLCAPKPEGISNYTIPQITQENLYELSC